MIVGKLLQDAVSARALITVPFSPESSSPGALFELKDERQEG